VPKGKTTKLPSNHIDVAPTFLGFTGLSKSKWPEFFDGRDLSAYWTPHTTELSPPPETVNIEFWGDGIIESGSTAAVGRNTYKTVRIVGEDYGYLYSHWCTNETELYDTVADPYELTPIAREANPRLHSRLNALLLTTKSCEQASCRNPWKTLHPDGSVSNLRDALALAHDEFYDSLPTVAFKQCLGYLLKENEAPFYPTEVEFGTQFRDKNATDGFVTGSTGAVRVQEEGHWGDAYQPLEVIEKTARDLTDEELGLAAVATQDRFRMLRGF
jgi:hypothetical protein